MTFRVFTEPVMELLNQIARGDTRDIFVAPEALSALMKLDLVVQQHVVGSDGTATNEFTVTTRGWIFVTCSRAIALNKLKDAAPGDASGDSRLGPKFSRAALKPI